MDIHPLAIVVADLAILLGFLAVIARPFRAGLRSLLTALADLADVKAEVLPNHGSSLRDAVDRLEAGQAHIKDELARQSDRMDDHISAHFRV